MSRYTGPRNKLSRRLGIDVFERGSRSLERRMGQPPGQHGQRRRKLSEYALQLQEKQKARFRYGLTETQLRRVFERATRAKGPTGETFMSLLERRLDNVVFRLGFARSRAQARQYVNHGHVLVNGHRVNIPSYTVSVGEVIRIAPSAQNIPLIQEMEQDRPMPVPRWLQREEWGGRVVALPERADIPPDIADQLIVEFYSR